MASNRLSSVANAARVLKSFSSSQPVWGVTELARHLDLSTSTAHRLLSTLTDEGVLDQDLETGQYRLGLSIFDLAAAAPTQRSLHEAALVSMTELRSRTGETVQVGVLDGRQVVYVERLDSPHTLRVFSEMGRRNDAHCTSTGKVLLAHAPAAHRDRLLRGWTLPRQTEHTITVEADLRSELQRIRRRGFAENRQESELGVVSIAAPVRDASGSVVAAMSLAGPSERVDPHRNEYAEMVVRLTATISKHMGWQRR
ncbi:MAG: IclR family transcriptional regulator [Actinomycetota bacterium]